MVRSCAVPKCKTGYKSVKEKCSVFSVPKNTELFKKWQAAIPGIVLRPSQSVCAKHFEEKCILKEWVGRDLEGRIIAKVRYKHVRLVEDAVPTIFNDFTTSVPPISDKPTDGVLDGSNSVKDECESLEDPLMDTHDAESADASFAMPCAPQETVKHEVLPVTPIPSVRYKHVRLVKSAVPIIVNNFTSVPPISDKPMDGVFDSSNSVKDECGSLEDPLMDTPDAESADASCAMPHAPQETVKHKVRYKHVRLVKSAVPIIVNNFTTSVPPISDTPMDGVFDGSNSVKDECESFEDPLMDIPDAESADASCAMPRAPQETVKHEVLPVKPVPYKHVRLVKSAVPIIVNNFTTSVPPNSDKSMGGVFDGSNSVKDECESLEDPLMDTHDAESADASCAMSCAPQETVKHEVLPVTPIPSVRYKLVRLVKSGVPTIFNNFTTSVSPISDKPTDGVFDGSDSLKDECESLEDPLMDTPDAVSADASCAMPHAPQETVKHKVLPVTPVPSAVSTSPKQEVVKSDSIVHRKNFVLSNITINDFTSNIVTSEKNPITIPTSWGVTEYEEQRGQRVVFSSILRTNKNGTASIIINKTVEVEADKTLRYCVYGCLIDSERLQLPPVLTDTTLLPEILWTFRRLNVCHGIGPINIHHLMIDCVFQDSVQQWRDNNCTILAKLKRCEHCKKMRHRAIQREFNWKKTENENIHRFRHLSNPIDRRKLNALRKKMSQEKRANHYLKRRVQLLTELLKEKAKKLSN